MSATGHRMRSVPPEAAFGAREVLRCRFHDLGEGVCRLSLHGELDLLTVPEVEAALRSADADTLVVDLEELSFVDCAGANALRVAGRRARERGRRLIAVNASAFVERLFELIGIDEELTIVKRPPGAVPAPRTFPPA
jgi:anti-sigma B factor antagonist